MLDSSKRLMLGLQIGPCGQGSYILTDKVTNVTNIFSLASKNSGLVATLGTRFPYDLDLNKE